MNWEGGGGCGVRGECGFETLTSALASFSIPFPKFEIYCSQICSVPLLSLVESLS